MRVLLSMQVLIGMGRLGTIHKLGLAGAIALHAISIAAAGAQQVDAAAVIQQVDRAVMARVNGISGYTVTEHYAVFRSHDEDHPAAEMTVKTTYRKESGKSYEILSQSGSAVLQKVVLGAILDNEKKINQPGVREGSWFVSANYDMKLKSGQIEQIDGRDCVALSISPKRKATYLIEGTIWVDAKDGTIVRVEGQSSKSPSMFTGPTQMSRQYVNIDGFSEATHARAVSNSGIVGQTVVKIDYSGYQIELAPRQPTTGK